LGKILASRRRAGNNVSTANTPKEHSMNPRIPRRAFLGASAAVAAGLSAGRPRSARAAAKRPTVRDTFGLLEAGKKIPVIFDTDIGGDIDDTWALVMVLKSPELDVKLVTSDSGNDTYRARIIAKMLELAGRTEIPVGVGCRPGDAKGRQSEWVGDYKLAQYPGEVYEDGVEAIIQTIRASDEPISLVAVGPVPNVAEALRRAPDIADRARFVGMHGSVRRGYGNNPKIAAEYNVRADPKALQAVFAAPWEVSITPLDTCGIVHLVGEKYQKVYHSKDQVTQALVENYRVWCKARGGRGVPDPTKRSSTLFDTVAVYMAFTEKLLEMENLPLRVTDDGRTLIDDKARSVRCAMRWKDLPAFEDELVRRITSGG
jgi:inosine-uridine nucleoside N-ribohydrolase